MFFALCGGTCSGKTTIAKYLEQAHGFQKVNLCQSKAVDLTSESRSFSTAEQLLAHVTSHWQQNWLLTHLSDHTALDLFARRPFFQLLTVEAPILVRYARCVHRYEGVCQDVPSLEQFIAEDDKRVFNHKSGLPRIANRAKLSVINDYENVEALYCALATLDLTDQSRLRPSWDQYFMELADLAAQRSNCMKRLVGCVLVREKRVISTGYNGTPRGMTNCNGGGCPRCNSGSNAGVGLDTCLCLHAEENALLEAGRDRIREGATLYCNTCPCLTCSVKIAQVGISEVVYNTDYNVDSMAASIFKEAGVKLRQFTPASIAV